MQPIPWHQLPQTDGRVNITGWISDDRFFSNKPQAVWYASQNNSDIRYFYNDHVFGQRDWSIEPVKSLPELYRERALELRDRYDYVVLLFSGGSDSTNMVRTFLDNGIYIDEVISYGAWNHAMDKMDPCNIEITLAAAPVIEMMIKNGTKFTHLNLFDAWDDAFRSEEWIFAADPSLAIYCDFVNQSLYRLAHLQHLAELGRKICFVWGIEKAQVFVSKGWYHLVFKDQIMQGSQYGNCSAFGYSHETFYSNVTCGDIIAKQAHAFLDYLDSTVPADKIMDFLNPKSEEAQVKNKLFYSQTWNPNTFSLGKNQHQMHSQKWITVVSKMNSSPQYQHWVHGVRQFFDCIDDRFIDGKNKHLRKFFKTFPIRPIRLSTS
jgi:hypothetical protein